MSIWQITGEGDYLSFSDISEIQVLSGTKRKELVFTNVSNVVFYPAAKMLEFIDATTGKRVFVHSPFILKE